MSIVADILAKKGTEVITGNVGDTVAEVANKMADRKIGAVLILDGERLAGIVSERDCTRGVVAAGKSAESTNVEEIMTSNVRCVRRDTTVDQCLGLMSEKTIRHLPVLDDERLVGLVSVSDIVTAVFEDQTRRIENLQTDVLVANSNLQAFLS